MFGENVLFKLNCSINSDLKKFVSDVTVSKNLGKIQKKVNKIYFGHCFHLL